VFEPRLGKGHSGGKAIPPSWLGLGTADLGDLLVGVLALIVGWAFGISALAFSTSEQYESDSLLLVAIGILAILGSSWWFISTVSDFFHLSLRLRSSRKRETTEDENDRIRGEAYAADVRTRMMEKTREMQEERFGGSHIPPKKR
jgi:hypothetical protein